MSNSYSTTSSQSWFSRIGNALIGVLIGLVMFIGSFFLLGWNEYRSVQAITGLGQALRSVVSVEIDRVDPANNDRLVHATGEVTTDETVRDPLFGIAAQAIRLQREVSMYQWEQDEKTETRKKVGGGTETYTSYSYRKVWSTSRINSSHFNQSSSYRNPDRWPFNGETFEPSRVNLGAFVVPSSLLMLYTKQQPVPVSQADVDRLRAESRPAAERDTPPADAPPAEQPLDGDQAPDAPSTAETPSEAAPEGAAWQTSLRLDGSEFYVGDNPEEPRIGDIRVGFSIAPLGPVSIVAQQSGDTFTSWTSSNGYRVGLLDAGIVPAAEVIAHKQSQESMLTWILRVVGFLVMAFGLALMLRPLSVLADVLPFLGNLVGTGTAIIAGIVALSLTLVTIAVSWLAVRPLWGAGLLAAGVAVLLLLRTYGRKGPATPSETPPPPPPPNVG